MTPHEYIQRALRTESGKYLFEATNGVSPRVEHAAMGVVTEAGELMSAIKKAKIYGKPLDKVNLIEEAGDVMWYLAILADDLGVSFEEMWEKNIAKLRLRYPEKYTDEQCENRDLEGERKILEGS
jgi:NTP pyrophosphatase (non-canonical NTP hydrolase)